MEDAAKADEAKAHDDAASAKEAVCMCLTHYQLHVCVNTLFDAQADAAEGEADAGAEAAKAATDEKADQTVQDATNAADAAKADAAKTEAEEDEKAEEAKKETEDKAAADADDSIAKVLISQKGIFDIGCVPGQRRCCSEKGGCPQKDR